MEEPVAIPDEPIGIADALGQPIAIEGGEVVFDEVTFHYHGRGRQLRSRDGQRARLGR
ncbi:hypothetical protein ACVWZR_002011 [Bradyrhizobium sp. i1.3.1]